MAFEGPEPSGEAIAYSRELAHRMSGQLVLLRLLSRQDGQPRGGNAAGRLRSLARRLSASGLPTSVEVRVGDPRSELLKFMVTAPSPLAVVWGGEEKALVDTARRPAHWISLVRDELGCPLVTMHRKKTGTPGASGIGGADSPERPRRRRR